MQTCPPPYAHPTQRRNPFQILHLPPFDLPGPPCPLGYLAPAIHKLVRARTHAHSREVLADHDEWLVLAERLLRIVAHLELAEASAAASVFGEGECDEEERRAWGASASGLVPQVRGTVTGEAAGWGAVGVQRLPSS